MLAKRTLLGKDAAFFTVFALSVFSFLYIFSAFGAGIDGVSLVSPANLTFINGTNDTIPFIFNYTGENSSASCMLFINDTEYGINATVENATQTTLYVNSSIGEGVLTWFVNCTNTTTVKSPVRTLYVDRTEPVVSLISPQDHTNFTTVSVDFQFNVTDTLSPFFNCSLFINDTLNTYNATTPNATTANFTVSLSQGMIQNWTINCTDNASNYHKPSVRYFGIDTANPSVTIHLPASNANYSTNESLSLNYTATDTNLDKCWYQIESANTTIDSCANTTFNVSAGGTYNLILWANDTAGNRGSGAVTFTSDLTNPSASLGTNPVTNYNSSLADITFEVTCTDTQSMETAQLWGNWSGGWHMNQTNASYINGTTWSVQVAGIADGTYVWGTWCNDSSGRSDWSDTNRTFNVDTNVPVVAITYPENTTYYNTTHFNFTVSKTPDTCWYINDTGANTTISCVNGTVLSLVEGSHNLSVYVNDSSGNIGGDTVYFTLDQTPPDIENVTNGTLYAIRGYITWDTTETSNSSILFGTNETLLNQSINSSSLVSSHNLTARYLVKNTTYYYNVSSCDAAGNCNTTGPENFTTPTCTPSYTDCGSWSTCTSSQQSRTCYDANWCSYPRLSTTQTQSCDSGDTGTTGTTSTSSAPPEDVTVTPELSEPESIDSNTLLKDAIKDIVKDIISDSQEEMSDEVKEKIKEISSEIRNVIKTERKMAFSGTQTTMTTTMKYSGTKKVKNFMVFESVPKSFSVSASQVRVNASGGIVEVVEEDPSWIITFPDVNPGDDLSITYETSGKKGSSVPEQVTTEVYGESLEDVSVEEPGDETAGTLCTPGEMRCYGSDLQQCTQDGSSWEIFEECQYGCSSLTLQCEGIAQEDAGPVSLIELLDTPTIVFITGIVAFLVIINAARFMHLHRKHKKRLDIHVSKSSPQHQHRPSVRKTETKNVQSISVSLKPSAKKTVKKRKKRKTKPSKKGKTENKKNDKEPVLIRISDIEKYNGRRVLVDCSLSLTKSIEEGNIKIYWYTATDGTGDAILTSHEKIDTANARIECSVDRTKTGHHHLVFEKIIGKKG